MTPLVSIITVCFNSEGTISRTIKSVLNQTYENIEYIIVDGKSSDKTVELVKTFEDFFVKKGYSFRLLSEPDEGIYDAMNKGIAISSGEIVGIINSDDWYEADAISQVVKAYNTNNFEVCYGDLNVHKPSGMFVKRAKLRKFVSTRHWNHPTTFITRKVYLESLYSLKKGIYADWDLILRLKKEGKKFVIINKVLANFMFGGISNKKSLALTKSRISLRYSIYRANGYSKLYFVDCVLVELAKFFVA